MDTTHENTYLKHLKTIIKHRHKVCSWCFKMGIYWQGLIHDLSKFSPTEMSIHKYYIGTRSPHEVARDQIGYSPSWYHHKNRNKHHWEYWLDNEKAVFTPIKIPYKYVIEMVCDFIGAGQVYSNGNWNPSMPLEYHNKTKNTRLFHKETLNLFEMLLHKLEELGEQEFPKWFRRNKKGIETLYNEGFYNTKNNNWRQDEKSKYSSSRNNRSWKNNTN